MSDHVLRLSGTTLFLRNMDEDWCVQDRSHQSQRIEIQIMFVMEGYRNQDYRLVICST